MQIPNPKIFEEQIGMELLKNFQAQCEKDLSNDGALAQTNFHATSHMDSKQLENLAKKRKYPVAMASKLWFKQAFLLRADLLYQYTTTPDDQDSSLLESRPVFGHLVKYSPSLKS